jgi:hypothetical protein
VVKKKKSPNTEGGPAPGRVTLLHDRERVGDMRELKVECVIATGRAIALPYQLDIGFVQPTHPVNPVHPV